MLDSQPQARCPEVGESSIPFDLVPHVRNFLDKQMVRRGLIKPDARFREERIVVPYAMSKADIPVRRLDRVALSP